MKPLSTTRSGFHARTCSSSASPQASRSAKFEAATEKVGMPNSSACARPSASRSAPTATTRAGNSASSHASSSARRFEPPPEISTTSESTRTSLAAGLSGGGGAAAAREHAEHAARRDLERGADADRPGVGSDVRETAGARRAGRRPGQQAQQHAADDARCEAGEAALPPAETRLAGAGRAPCRSGSPRRAARRVPRSRSRIDRWAARRAPGAPEAGRAAVPSGLTSEPVPIAKPGPTSQLAVQITRFGRSASCPRVIAMPPSTSPCRLS